MIVCHVSIYPDISDAIQNKLDDCYHVIVSYDGLCDLAKYFLNFSDTIRIALIRSRAPHAKILRQVEVKLDENFDPILAVHNVQASLAGGLFDGVELVLDMEYLDQNEQVCELQEEQQQHCEEQQNQDCSLFEDGEKLIYDDSNSAGRRALQCVGCKLKGVSIALSYDDPAGICVGSRFPLLSAVQNVFEYRSGVLGFNGCPSDSQESDVGSNQDCFRSWSCSASRQNVLKPLDQHQLTQTAAAAGSVGVTGGPPPPPGHFTFRRQFEARLNNSWRTALFIKWYAVLINVVEAVSHSDCLLSLSRSISPGLAFPDGSPFREFHHRFCRAPGLTRDIMDFYQCFAIYEIGKQKRHRRWPAEGHFPDSAVRRNLHSAMATLMLLSSGAAIVGLLAQNTTLLLPYYFLHVATLVLELNYVVIRVATAVSWTGGGGKSGNHRRRTSTVRTLATLAYITFNLLIMIGAEFGPTGGGRGEGLLWRAEYPPFWHLFSTMMARACPSMPCDVLLPDGDSRVLVRR
ncbi:conserved hypothetical protein [Culex quinquefasciatus]|uniref:Uncharacterized protein n=1 Tax=Culex quinquefasciatus TaxID=7176 RepID=B0XHZ0_CULQU|nr:conserved hypothetical protein [Culex quinquefasciatus]|eukprot:XP_001869262.1 conserved hypothetical protein [Culex quinquefasciatus]